MNTASGGDIPKNQISETLVIFGQGLEEFISNTPTPMAVFDREMRYVGASKEWITTYGLDSETLIGRCLYDVSPWLPDESREAHRLGLAGQSNRSDFERIELPEGSVLWHRWAVQPFRDSGGHVTGVVLIAEDITDHKKIEQRLNASEHRLHYAMEAAGIGLFDKDYETDDVFVSPTLQTLLKTDVPLLQIEDWAALLGTEDFKNLTLARERALDPTGDGRFSVTLHPDVNGVTKALEFQGKVDFAGEGSDRHPTRAIGVILDRTESSRMTDALAAAQRLETVGRMAGMIAHDFNNLLTVILSNLEFAGRENLSDQTRERLASAIEATKLGAGFNRRLLALAGSQMPRPKTFILDMHLTRTWSVIRRVLGEAIRVRLHPDASDGYVHIDRGELDAALLNLVVNARDAMGGTGDITITTGVERLSHENASQLPGARPGNFVRLTVADSGKGMTPEVLAQATEPFFTTKPSDRGAGLGLTSVATTVARPGGFMSIESDVGRGTAISLYLPLVDAPLQHEAEPAETTVPLGDGELILVVEDDALVRETVLDRLEALGYAVLDAGDVDKAIEIIGKGEPINLVFSDIVLPGEKTGYDLAAHLRSNHPDIPILLTSGHTSRLSVTDLDRFADVDLLQKPYTLKALALAVSQALKPSKGQVPYPL